MASNTTVLDGPGASKHLRLLGIVGDEHVFTDADVRADPHDGKPALDSLRRGKFVRVDEFRVGQRDGVYTVRWETPTITSLPALKVKSPTVPPKAKRKNKSTR